MFKVIEPFDPKYRFNKQIGGHESNPSSLIHSIDPGSLLTFLNDDNLEEIRAISLNGAAAQGKVGIWDVLYNTNKFQQFTACILTATDRFEPIAHNRVVQRSDFINYLMWVSRLHLSQIRNGDRLGIGIRDNRTGVTFMLVYVVMGADVSLEPDTVGGGKPKLRPTINLKLDHAFRIDRATGRQDGIEMEDASAYDPELMTPFVQHLFNTVSDIPTGFSWKPHYIPMGDRISISRGKIEGRIKESFTNATPVEYEDFCEITRALYRQAKAFSDARKAKAAKEAANREGGNGNAQHGRRPKVEPVPLPVIEAVTMGDKILVTFPGDPYVSRYPYIVMDRAHVEERAGITETFLLNRDVTSPEDIDTNTMLALRENVFGKDSLLRYLSVDF